MLKAVHKRSGNVQEISEVIEYSEYFIKAISDGITYWFGKLDYTFVIPHE